MTEIAKRRGAYLSTPRDGRLRLAVAETRHLERLPDHELDAPLVRHHLHRRWNCKSRALFSSRGPHGCALQLPGSPGMQSEFNKEYESLSTFRAVPGQSENHDRGACATGWIVNHAGKLLHES